jgi:hypothetical protein
MDASLVGSKELDAGRRGMIDVSTWAVGLACSAFVQIWHCIGRRYTS